MTVDVKVYEFSKLWLRTGGWCAEIDIDRLAMRLQETLEDFEADMMNEYEKEAQHDRS
jgi:hypothetical protein